MHDDVKKMNAFRLDLANLFEKLVIDLHSTLAHIKGTSDAPYNDVALCDIGFCMRKMEGMFDEMRKEAKAKAALAGLVLAARRIQDDLACESGASLSVKGELAIAIPNVRQEATPPKRGTPEFTRLCDVLEIPEDVRENGLMSFHYGHLSEWITRLAARGKNIPDGLGEPRAVFYSTFRERKPRKETN